MAIQKLSRAATVWPFAQHQEKRALLRGRSFTYSCAATKPDSELGPETGNTSHARRAYAQT